MAKDTEARSNRVAAARAALAVERKADEAVDRILGDLAEMDDDAMERVLSRLVGLLQGNTPSQYVQQALGQKTREFAFEPSPAQGIADLPVSVRPGAKFLKRQTGLPEDAVAERVAGWVATCGEDNVANVFAAMKDERPPHEISFIEQHLGLE